MKAKPVNLHARTLSWLLSLPMLCRSTMHEKLTDLSSTIYALIDMTP